jgi:hypothetical protein
MSQSDQQTHIYERVDDIVYVRQPGSTERTEAYRLSPDCQELINFQTWQNICKLAKDNEMIRQQLERLLICYKLV